MILHLKRCKVKSFTQTKTNPQSENLSVDTKRKTYSCYPSRHTFPHPPLSLALPSYPTFPSHPLGVLCATAETTDGAQHHPESERERENRGRLHSLFTSLGIGILMLKAIGQPFIKLTGDVGKETRGWDGRMGGAREAETVGEERERSTLC